MRWLRVTPLLLLIICACLVGVRAQSTTPPVIPRCTGLTIVTAVNQQDGDYESIKTIESVTASEVRLKYSVEREVQDWLSNGPPKLVKYTLYRTLRRTDLDSAVLYEQQFSTELPEMIPDTTAIGTSAAVLNGLKTKGESKLGIFIAYTQIKPPIDRNVHPNVYDNQMVTAATRVGDKPVMMPVLVKDVPAELPAIQARRDFFGDRSEFFFLDDAANPLSLKFRIGIDAIKALNAQSAKSMGMQPRPASDKDVLQVIKITYHCGELSMQNTGGKEGQRDRLGQGENAGTPSANFERALSESGTADIYGIYFSFNSDVIRGESEPAPKEIAELMKRHSDWKVQVNGHTDGIGTDQYNLDLSKRRQTVKDALVKRYGIDAARLTTQGFGKSQPKDTNDTLEGGARNRRVELVRK